jgi:hypothetical protein
MSTITQTEPLTGRSPNPTLVASRLFMTELLRRWPTVLFMVLMPVAYFLISYGTSDGTTVVPVDASTVHGEETFMVLDRDVKALYLAVLGISVTSSFAALHSVQNSQPAMRRLRMCGMSSTSLLLARSAVLGIVMALACAIFMALFVPLVDTSSGILTLLALLAVSAIGVGLGTLVGLVMPRQFEAAMVLIALAGIQMALGRGDSDAGRFLPYWPGIEALKSTVFAPDPAAFGPLAQAAAYAAVLFLIAAVIWTFRTRVRPPTRKA